MMARMTTFQLFSRGARSLKRRLATPFGLILLLTWPCVGSAAQKPVKVFILAGQSNMEGKAKVSLLEYQVKQPTTRPLFERFQKDGRWLERDDVLIKFLERKGKLTMCART